MLTKEWTLCWYTMRDKGDEAALKILRPLRMKDKFDHTRVGLDGANADELNLGTNTRTIPPRFS